MKKVLLTATVQSHICQFHKPLAKLLKENGFEVHIAARDNLAEKNGLKIEYVDKVFNVPFDRSPLSFSNIKAYKELSKILKENKYDVIHCNTPVGGIITRLLANKYRKQGTKVFYTAHGFHFYKGAPKKNWLLYYPIEKFMSRYTDKLITINHEDYELAKNKFNCDVYHVHGVGVNSNRCFILPKDETAQIKRTLGFDKDDKIILNVGELLPNKNQKTAILAMTKVVKIIPNSKLLIAGNGILKEELQELIDKHSLNDNVKLIGYTTEINKYMNICDLLVACSFREGLPLNLMEAMLCGKFIVASKNRGHNELITNGVNGYLFDPDNADELANLIINALNNTNINKDKILELVNPYIDKNVVDELANIYELEK